MEHCTADSGGPARRSSPAPPRHAVMREGAAQAPVTARQRLPLPAQYCAPRAWVDRGSRLRCALADRGRPDNQLHQTRPPTCTFARGGPPSARGLPRRRSAAAALRRSDAPRGGSCGASRPVGRRTHEPHVPPPRRLSQPAGAVGVRLASNGRCAARLPRFGPLVGRMAGGTGKARVVQRRSCRRPGARDAPRRRAKAHAEHKAEARISCGDDSLGRNACLARRWGCDHA